MKCNLCDKYFEKKRAMHAHLLRMHHKEYEAVGFCMDSLVSSPAKEVDLIDGSDNRPKGFRLLNLHNAQEAIAYNEGYRYIDEGGVVYEPDEVKGWV